MIKVKVGYEKTRTKINGYYLVFQILAQHWFLRLHLDNVGWFYHFLKRYGSS
jgi:hypothetical protein